MKTYIPLVLSRCMCGYRHIQSNVVASSMSCRATVEEITQHDQEITQVKETASLQNMLNNEMATGDIISTIINLSNASYRNYFTDLIEQIIL